MKTNKRPPYCGLHLAPDYVYRLYRKGVDTKLTRRKYTGKVQYLADMPEAKQAEIRTLYQPSTKSYPLGHFIVDMEVSYILV